MRELLLGTEENQTIQILAKTWFFPVKFMLPDSVKETLPASKTRAIEGTMILRFYTPPVPGDPIYWKGFLWEVIGRAHMPQMKGSPKKDICPTVLVSFAGEAIAE
jgi:hypothetical protein